MDPALHLHDIIYIVRYGVYYNNNKKKKKKWLVIEKRKEWSLRDDDYGLRRKCEWAPIMIKERAVFEMVGWVGISTIARWPKYACMLKDLGISCLKQKYFFSNIKFKYQSGDVCGSILCVK